MSQRRLHLVWILVAAGAVFFFNLGYAALFDDDEGFYGTCAREMFVSGDWMLPTFNGEVFTEKPPLMFWLMGVGFQLFGITEFAARFWSACFGVATAVATYELGRRLISPRAGFWAGLAVSSSIVFTISARAATIDSLLTLLTTLAMLVFTLGGIGNRERPAVAVSPAAARSRRPAFVPGFGCFVLIYVLLSLAVLAKGPIGILLPMAVLGQFLLVMNDRAEGRSPSGGGAAWLRWLIWLVRLFRPRNFLKSVWQLRPLTALAVLALVAVPWYVWAGVQTDGLWLREFFGVHNFHRAASAMHHRWGPFVLYYIAIILVGFFPWSVFLRPALANMVRGVRAEADRSPVYVLLACWVGVVVMFWSCVSTKFPHYVLPAYPALALLTGAFIDGWLAEPARARPAWMREALLTLVLVGVGFAVAMPIVAARLVPGEGLLGWIGVVLLFGAAACYYYHRAGRTEAALRAFAVTSAAFLIAIFGVAIFRINPRQNAPQLAAAVGGDESPATTLVAYRYFKPSFPYYCGQPLRRCGDVASLRELLSNAEHPCIVTLGQYEEELNEAMPGQWSVVFRMERFLRPGEVIVLRQTATLAARTDRPARQR
jgi:4-amino-4-deoxy-L-arabinose transferase-like glycosyltransferase